MNETSPHPTAMRRLSTRPGPIHHPSPRPLAHGYARHQPPYPATTATTPLNGRLMSLCLLTCLPLKYRARCQQRLGSKLQLMRGQPAVEEAHHVGP